MNLDSVLNKLSESGISFGRDVPMSRNTTFKIGGNADAIVKPANTAELEFVIKSAIAFEVPYFILGRGSNLLVSDDGIEGLVISLSEINDISLAGDVVTCGAGVKLSNLCIFAANNSLSGLEFAYGIPGSVGGAMFMNAGAYGGEMSQVVKSADYIDKNGSFGSVSAEDMCLGYRTSIFKKEGLTVVSVSFKLSKDEKEAIKGRMDDFLSRRKSKQPLEYPSAGSTFKRPEGYFAGALIEKNGFKGQGVGSAEVSEKHAGFIINKGNATCKDVLALIEKIKKTVLAADGVELEPEVIAVGRGL